MIYPVMVSRNLQMGGLSNIGWQRSDTTIPKTLRSQNRNDSFRLSNKMRFGGFISVQKDKKCIGTAQKGCLHHTRLKRDNIKNLVRISHKNNHQIDTFCVALMSFCFFWYQIYLFFPGLGKKCLG